MGVDSSSTDNAALARTLQLYTGRKSRPLRAASDALSWGLPRLQCVAWERRRGKFQTGFTVVLCGDRAATGTAAAL